MDRILGISVLRTGQRRNAREWQTFLSLINFLIFLISVELTFDDVLQPSGGGGGGGEGGGEDEEEGEKKGLREKVWSAVLYPSLFLANSDW